MPGFAWDMHVVAEALALPVPGGGLDYGGKLVAANNELIHPVVEALFAEFAADFDPEAVRHYANHGAAIERVAGAFGWPPEQVLLAAGSDAGIELAIASLAGTSGRLILQWPNYGGYELYATLRRVEVMRVCTAGLPADAVEARLIAAMKTTSPALVAVTNPSGFDGSALTVEAVARLAAVAMAAGHVLLIDEAYVGFSSIDHAWLPRAHPNLLLVRSFSKSMGLAGLRIAAMVTGDRVLADYLRRWCPGHPVSVVAAQFLAFCLDRREAIAAARADIVDCREWLARRAAALLPHWRILASAGNFVCLSAPDRPAHRAMLGAFEEAGIAVRDISHHLAPRLVIRVTVGHRPVSERILAVVGSQAACTAARSRSPA